MLDPACIHTLYNVDRLQKDTVLIQMVLGYTTKRDKRTLIDSVKVRFGDAAEAKTFN